MMKNPSTADQIRELDRVRAERFGRDPYRPASPKAARRREPQPIELKRAKTRLRTAAWRKAADDAKRPQGEVVASAVLDALLLMDGIEDKRGRTDLRVADLVRSVFSNLIAAGYDKTQIDEVLKRRRQNLMRDRGVFDQPSGPWRADSFMPRRLRRSVHDRETEQGPRLPGEAEGGRRASELRRSERDYGGGPRGP